MKIFICVVLGYFTMCKGAFLSSSGDPAQNSVDYTNDDGKDEIITIVEETDLNQNYQQNPGQNYIPPSSLADEIIQTIRIVEEIQPEISSSANVHTTANVNTAAHFPTYPSHQYAQQPLEEQPRYAPPIQEQPQEYLQPFSDSQESSGYLPPLADTQPQYSPPQPQYSPPQPQYSPPQPTPPEYIPPVAPITSVPQLHSVIPQNNYSPIQSQHGFVPLNQPAKIQPQQQYIPPVQQHPLPVHQPVQEYVPPSAPHQPTHFSPPSTQQRIQTIRIIHEIPGHATQGKPASEAVKTLRIIKSFVPTQSDGVVKSLNTYQNQPKQIYQQNENTKPSRVNSGDIRSKTLRIVHSSANPVAVPGHQAHHTKTIKVIRKGSSASNKQNIFGGTRTIRIIKQQSPVQPNNQYLALGHMKKFKF